MADDSSNRLAKSWLILLALTGMSVLIVRFGGATTTVVFVLGLAVLKTRFVVLDFMGMRGRNQVVMRRALIGWCLMLALGAAARAIAVAWVAG